MVTSPSQAAVISHPLLEVEMEKFKLTFPLKILLRIITVPNPRVLPQNSPRPSLNSTPWAILNLSPSPDLHLLCNRIATARLHTPRTLTVWGYSKLLSIRKKTRLPSFTTLIIRVYGRGGILPA